MPDKPGTNPPRGGQPPPEGSHGDAAREADRLDRIARDDALTGGAEGGISEQDAINVAKDQRIRDGEIFARPEIDPPTSLDLPLTGPDPAESVLEDLGPDEAHNAMLAGMGGGEGQSVGDLLRGAPQPKPGGGMQQIDPPLTETSPPPPGDFPPPGARDMRGCLLFLASGGFTLLGILMFLWALTGGRTQTEFGVIRSEPLSTFTLTPRPATATPTARPATPLAAGVIVATQPGTTTVYTVEGATGDGLRYRWSHSATCGQHAGEDTASYSWDHPHQGRPGDCAAEPTHTGFISVQISDANGMAVVRQYTRGSADGRGTLPASPGPFSVQQTTPPAARTSPGATAAPTTAAPTATAGSTSGTQSDPNYPLAGAGLLVTLGGLGLGYGGKKYGGLTYPIPWPPGGVAQQDDKQKNPCEDEKRREAQARARRDAARQKSEQLDRLRAESERAQAELSRAQQREARSKDDRFISWGEDAETGRRIYTNPDQRAEVANAEAALGAARAAAEAARGAYNGAGGDAAHAAAKEELAQAEAEWQAADAALRECLRLNAPPPPPPPPATGGATTTGGGAAVAGGETGGGTGGGTRVRQPQPPTPPTPPIPPTPPTPPTGGGVGPETQPRVCTPGQKKPDSEQSSTHDYQIADLRSATIVARHSAMRTEEVPLGQGSDGPGPRGERGSGAFGEVFTYWSDASGIGAGRARGAVTRDSRLQVQGDYSVRYTVHKYTLTCTRWSECNAQGTGWVQRGRVMMAYAGSEEVQTEPPVTVEVQHSDRNTVTRAVLAAVQKIFAGLQAQNTAAEQGAKQFTARCK